MYTISNSHRLYLELKTTINPLADSNCNGIDLYIKFVIEKYESY